MNQIDLPVQSIPETAVLAQAASQREEEVLVQRTEAFLAVDRRVEGKVLAQPEAVLVVSHRKTHQYRSRICLLGQGVSIHVLVGFVYHPMFLV